MLAVLISQATASDSEAKACVSRAICLQQRLRYRKPSWIPLCGGMESLTGFTNKGLFSKINQLSNATGILSRLAAFLSDRTTSSEQLVLFKVTSPAKLLQALAAITSPRNSCCCGCSSHISRTELAML